MPRPWSLDLLLFDLDGTLVDSVRGITSAVNRVLESLGKEPLSEGVVLGYLGDGSRALMRRCLGGIESPEALGRLRRVYRERPCRGTRLYPGVRRLLEHTGGIACALITNKPLEIALAVLEGMGIDGPFDPVLGEGSVPRNKPAPDAIRFVLDALGVDPSRAAMVGDGPQDLEAGRRAGVRTVAALYGYGDRERLLSLRPDAALEGLEDLAGLVLGEGEGRPGQA